MSLFISVSNIQHLQWTFDKSWRGLFFFFFCRVVIKYFQCWKQEVSKLANGFLPPASCSCNYPCQKYKHGDWCVCVFTRFRFSVFKVSSSCLSSLFPVLFWNVSCLPLVSSCDYLMPLTCVSFVPGVLSFCLSPLCGYLCAFLHQSALGKYSVLAALF